MRALKREEIGYVVSFWNRDKRPLHLGIEEGRRLRGVLNNNPPKFVTIASVDKTLQVSSIESVEAEYKMLEETCLFCYNPKRIGTRCPNGCDDKPNQKNVERLHQMKIEHGLIPSDKPLY